MKRKSFLSNPRDLFLCPNLFVVHSGTDAADRALAENIVRQCQGFTRPECGTADQLRRHTSFNRFFIGITVLILSPAMLTDPSRQKLLVDLMTWCHRDLLFRHYCVCRGMAVSSLEGYPALHTLLDDITVADAESQLSGILSELRDFVTRVLPNAPELAHPIATLFR